MSESEDVSNLIDNEELDQDAQAELGAFQNPGEADDVLDKVGADDNSENLKAGENVDELKADTNIQVLKADDISDTSKGVNNYDILKGGSESPKEADESEESHLKTNRGSLDLNKYLINSPNTNYQPINKHVEAIATVENAPNEVSTTSFTYNNHIREAPIVNEPIIIIKEEERHGEMHIQHSDTQEPQAQIAEVPFRKRKIKLLQVFSIAAVLIFFPLGIPAVYFAHKIEGELIKGILLGDIDRATQLIKRTEKLIIFSFIAAFLVVVTVFAVIESHFMANDDNYLQSKSNPGPLMG